MLILVKSLGFEFSIFLLNSWELLEGTKSLALITDDPDAPDPENPQMTWVHWVVYNIPSEIPGLVKALARDTLVFPTKKFRLKFMIENSLRKKIPSVDDRGWMHTICHLHFKTFSSQVSTL